MIQRIKFIFSICCGLAILNSPTSTAGRGRVQRAELPDPMQQRVGPIILENEYLVEGLAKINLQTTGVGFAIEFLPGTKNSPPPPDPKFRAQLSGGALQEALDWLCSLDPRYTWRRDGQIVNIVPRDKVDDPSYLFNRILSRLTFADSVAADDTLQPIFQPVSKPGESVIQLSGIGRFPKPLSAAFENISVRSALNRVAENLGVGHGWMVSGNNETRIITFYDLLLTKAEAERRKSHI